MYPICGVGEGSTRRPTEQVLNKVVVLKKMMMVALFARCAACWVAKSAMTCENATRGQVVETSTEL